MKPYKISFLLILLLSFGVFADETTQTTSTDAAVATTATKKKTKAPASPKKIEAPLNKQLTLDGVLPDEKNQIIRFAKKAGAVDAEMEGNVLKIYGEGFNQDNFETMLGDSIPGAKIQ